METVFVVYLTIAYNDRGSIQVSLKGFVSPMIRVLVIDDHPIVREAVCAILSAQPDIEVIDSAGTAEEGLELLRLHACDIVLLDLDLPGMSGLNAVPLFMEGRPPRPRIIIFTAYDNDERVFAALRSGARGYLLKGSSTDELVRAIHAVADGGSHLEPSVANKVLQEMNNPHPDSHTLLSDREMEVLRRVAEGLPNKQIARSLGISESTVKFHLTSIFQKLNADNRAQAVAMAVHGGLL